MAEVEELKSKMDRAFMSQDVQALAALLHPDFVGLFAGIAPMTGPQGAFSSYRKYPNIASLPTRLVPGKEP